MSIENRSRGKGLNSLIDDVDPLIHRKASIVVSKARKRARKAGIPFELRLIDIYQLLADSDICPILGVPMCWKMSLEGYEPYSRTIDRVDPSRGYVIDNVWIISRRANQIKSDASLPELITAMANLVNHLYQGEHNERTGIRHRDGSEAQYDLDLCN